MGPETPPGCDTGPREAYSGRNNQRYPEVAETLLAKRPRKLRQPRLARKLPAQIGKCWPKSAITWPESADAGRIGPEIGQVCEVSRPFVSASRPTSQWQGAVPQRLGSLERRGPRKWVRKHISVSSTCAGRAPPLRPRLHLFTPATRRPASERGRASRSRPPLALPESFITRAFAKICSAVATLKRRFAATGVARAAEAATRNAHFESAGIVAVGGWTMKRRMRVGRATKRKWLSAVPVQKRGLGLDASGSSMEGPKIGRHNMGGQGGELGDGLHSLHRCWLRNRRPRSRPDPPDRVGISKTRLRDNKRRRKNGMPSRDVPGTPFR